MSPKKKLKLKKNQPNESPEKCLSLEVPNENIPIKLPYQQEHEISSKKAAKRKKKDCKFLTFKPCKDSGSKWDQKSSNKLMERMFENITKPDTLKFVSGVEKLNWEKVAFKPFSVEECKARWYELGKPIRKFRTLSDLIVDAKEYLKDPYKHQVKKHPDYPKRPLTPYFRFFMGRRDDYAAKHPGLTNLQVTADISKLYKELPKVEKDKLISEWQAEQSEFIKAKEQFMQDHPQYFQVNMKVPTDSRTPMFIYRDENITLYMKNNPHLSKRQCSDNLKKEYKELEDEGKQIYIDKAMEEKEEYQREYEKFLEKNPTFKKTKKKEKRILSKYEERLFDRKNGKPPRPPSNGYNLFCTELLPKLQCLKSQTRIKECGKLWNKLSKDQKEEYHTRFIEKKTIYEKKLKAFLDSLTEAERAKEEAKLKNLKLSLLKPETNSSSVSSEDEFYDSDESSAFEDYDHSLAIRTNRCKDELATIGAIESLDINNFQPKKTASPISALFLYQKAHLKEVRDQYPWMTKNDTLKLLAQRFTELSRSKRHKYERKEKELKQLYNTKMQQILKEKQPQQNVQLIDPNEPKKPEPVTGEQLYKDEAYASFSVNYEGGDPNQLKDALTVNWNRLKRDEREPFVKKAMEINEFLIDKYLKDKEKYDESMGKSKSLHFAKDTFVDRAMQKMITTEKYTKGQRRKTLEGEPKKPPVNGYQLFNSIKMMQLQHLNHGEKFREIGRLWTNMTEAKKKVFHDEVKKQTEKYRKQMETWLKTLSPAMLEKYQLINRAHARKRKGALTKEMLEKAKTLSKIPRTDSFESETTDCIPAIESTQDDDVVEEELKNEKPDESPVKDLAPSVSVATSESSGTSDDTDDSSDDGDESSSEDDSDTSDTDSDSSSSEDESESSSSSSEDGSTSEDSSSSDSSESDASDGESSATNS